MKKIAIVIVAMVMSLVACDPKVSVSTNSGGSGAAAGMAGMTGSSGVAGMAGESSTETAGAGGVMPTPSASTSASN